MYVVVFRNRKRADIDQAAYDAVAAAMEAAGLTRPGYISFKPKLNSALDKKMSYQ